MGLNNSKEKVSIGLGFGFWAEKRFVLAIPGCAARDKIFFA